ncbi:unnamed protein product [Euphydryas editha]|uniref:Uncharacterized protein n=1 Tax=Euphydryas editha TaxID=104508 RepID=A0AAU9TAL5_EUPED|nr:unnamed protein product [Euphydryas editha]
MVNCQIYQENRSLALRGQNANDPHRAQYNEIKRIGLINKKHESKFIKPMFIQTEVKIKRKFYVYPNASNESVLPEFKPISDAQIKKINEIIRELKSTSKVQFKSTNDNRKGRILDSVPEASLTENSKKDDAQFEKNCSQGGTCEFFFYCWMVGGLLEGSCGGLLKSCCHRVAKAGLLGVQDSNSIEYSANEGHSFGPVINDESKCLKSANSITQLRNSY